MRRLVLAGGVAVTVGVATPLLPLPVIAGLIGSSVAAIFVASSWEGEQLSTRLGRIFAALAVGTITLNAVRVGLNLTLSDVLLLVAGVLLLPVVVKRRIPVWFIVAGVAVLVSSVLGALAADDPLAHLGPAAKFIVALCAVPLVIAAAGQPRMAARLFAFSAMVSGTVAVTDAVFGTGFGSAVTGLEHYGRASGLNDHPNHLGLASAMALPFAVYFVLAPGRLLDRGFGVATSMAIVGALLVSGSRGALGGAAIGVLALLVLSRGALSLRATILAVLAVLAAGAVLIATAPDVGSLSITLDRLTGRVSVGTSDISRLELSAGAIADFSSSPLYGIGFGVILEAHNIYLQLLQAGGLVALLGMGAYWLGALRLRDPAVGLSGAAAAALIAWLAEGFVHVSLDDRYLYVPVGILLALAYRRHAQADGRIHLGPLDADGLQPARAPIAPSSQL